MKLRPWFTTTLMLACGLLAGCDLNALIPQEARTFTVPAKSEVTVPGTGVAPNNPLVPDEVIPADFGQVISQELQQTFSTQDIDKDAVESLKLTGMRVVALQPDDGSPERDLGFLESMAFSLSAADLEPRLVALSEEGAFDADPLEVKLELTGEELADLLQASDELQMTADVEVDNRPTFDTTLRFEVEMTVVANVVGALN